MKENYRNLINHCREKASFQSEFCSHSAQCLPPSKQALSFRVREMKVQEGRVSQTAGSQQSWPGPRRGALDVHAPPAVSPGPQHRELGLGPVPAWPLTCSVLSDAGGPSCLSFQL